MEHIEVRQGDKIDGEITFVQGGQTIFFFRVLNEHKEPVDQTGIDEFAVCFLDESSKKIEIDENETAEGSKVERIGDPLLAKYKVTVNGAQTALMKTGDRKDLDVELVNSSDADSVKRYKALRVITVKSSNCDAETA